MMMKRLFSNILLALHNSTPNKSVLIDEALELSGSLGCNLHILYIDDSKQLSWDKFRLLSLFDQETDNDFEEQVSNRIEFYRKQLPATCFFYYSSAKGPVEDTTINYTIRNHIDLIMFGELSDIYFPIPSFRTLNINRLSKKVRCPILTLQAATSFSKVRNIVMPVSDYLPVRKLMFASYIARKYNSCLHLVGQSKRDEDNAAEKSNLSLLEAYRLLKENTGLMIECKTIAGHNLADITWQYAKKVKADLIVINTGSESLLSGMVNRLFSGFIYYRSKIPVMTVAGRLTF